MNRPRTPAVLPLVGLAILAFAFAACADIAGPEGWASPIVADGLLLASDDDELIALDAVDLRARWKFPRDQDDIRVRALYGTPATADGVAFIPAYDGNLYAVDLEDGSPLWAEPFRTNEPLVGGVAVGEGVVYAGSSDGNVYAVEAETGRQLWAFETNKEVWSTPALAGDAVYATSLDSNLYVIDAETGVERWSFSTGAGIAASPVVDEELGLVFVGGFDARVRAIDIETREERWFFRSNNWFWATPLLVEGAVYAGSLDGRVYALDAATGEQQWPAPFETDGPVRAAAVMVGDVLIVVDSEGDVYGINPEEGTAVRPALALGAGVHADPVVRVVGEEDEALLEVIIVTTDGELVRVDPETLSIVGRSPLS